MKLPFHRPFALGLDEPLILQRTWPTRPTVEVAMSEPLAAHPQDVQIESPTLSIYRVSGQPHFGIAFHRETLIIAPRINSFDWTGYS
jgi:hypothetical protein